MANRSVLRLVGGALLWAAGTLLVWVSVASTLVGIPAIGRFGSGPENFRLIIEVLDRVPADVGDWPQHCLRPRCGAWLVAIGPETGLYVAIAAAIGTLLIAAAVWIVAAGRSRAELARTAAIASGATIVAGMALTAAVVVLAEVTTYEF